MVHLCQRTFQSTISALLLTVIYKSIQATSSNLHKFTAGGKCKQPTACTLHALCMRVARTEDMQNAENSAERWRSCVQMADICEELTCLRRVLCMVLNHCAGRTCSQHMWWSEHTCTKNHLIQKDCRTHFSPFSLPPYLPTSHGRGLSLLEFGSVGGLFMLKGSSSFPLSLHVCAEKIVWLLSFSLLFYLAHYD